MIGSIIAVYILMAFSLLFLDYYYAKNQNALAYKFDNIFGSIRGIILMSGTAYIANQYYKIMNSVTGDYHILKVLGATRQNLCALIAVQAVYLMVISVLYGLLIGYGLVKTIAGFFAGIGGDTFIYQVISSPNTFAVISAVLCFCIMVIGIYIGYSFAGIQVSWSLSDYPVARRKCKNNEYA